jgi:hypothetical protein
MDWNWRNAFAGLLAVTAVGVGLLWAADLPPELNVDDAQAKQQVLSGLNSGSVFVGPARNTFRAAIPAQRAKLVESVLAWVKAYTETPEFATAYAAAREQSKPAAPAAKGSVDDELKQQRAEQQKQIEEMKKTAASMPAEQRKAMEEAIKSVIATTEQMQNDPQMQQIQRQGIEAGRTADQQQYEAALRNWEKDYPAAPGILIARRLREFLDVSGDVNFEAKLAPNDGKRRFADQQYEQKSSDWKLCYRAGKEAVTAARTVATAWLSELERK